MTAQALTGMGSEEILRFLLVLARCVAMMAILPVFSAKQLPAQIRLGISAFLAFLIARTLPPSESVAGLEPFVMAILSQVAVGAVFGFVASLVFAGIQFAGEIIDTQVGFAITNVINPLNGTNVSILGQLEITLASMLFFASDAHLMLIEGMAGSFHIVPLPYATLNPQLLSSIMVFFSSALMIVFKIAAPISVSLLITNVAMGLLARVAPQVNVFVVALPAQLGIGLVMFICALPIFGFVVPQMFHQLPAQLDTALHAMAPVKTH